MSDEIHHKIPQKQADSQGMVKPGIHKNNPANLMALCESCHHNIHSEERESDRDQEDQVSLLSSEESSLAVPKQKVVKRIVKRKAK